MEDFCKLFRDILVRILLRSCKISAIFEPGYRQNLKRQNLLIGSWKDQKKMLKSVFESFVCNLCAEKQEALTVAESEPSKPMAVKFGSLSEMMSHICESHTHLAFICLSCVQVIHVENSQVDFNLHIHSHFSHLFSISASRTLLEHNGRGSDWSA